MAFRPGGPGFSANAGAGGGPPPMMMFNPAQFSQPQAPQIPLPSSNPATQVQQGSQSTPVSAYSQHGATPSQEPGAGAFNSNQYPQQTPGQYQPKPSPESTSNAYQNAGVYQDYNNAGQIQHSQYEGSNWNYGQEGIQNSQLYQPPQSAEQYPNSMPHSLQQNQEPSHNSYNSQGGVSEDATQKFAMYQNQNPIFAQTTMKAPGGHEEMEGGHMPNVQENNSMLGQPSIPPSYMNSSPHPPIPQNPQDSSREPSVSHASSEHAISSNIANLETNTFNHSTYAQQPQVNSFNGAPTQPFPKPGQEMNSHPETSESLAHASSPWNPNSNLDYNHSASTFGGFSDSTGGTGNKQAQPDIVSATSSTVSPSTLPQQFPTSFEAAPLNSATLSDQQPSENQAAENVGQVGSTNHSASEMWYGNDQFSSSSLGWGHQNPPNSLPPLQNLYPNQSIPPTKMINDTGYGLGPDVITAVSSSSVSQAPSTETQVIPEVASDNKTAVESREPDSNLTENPLWESNVIAEETNQATVKMASRIDEMRKAKEAALPQQIPTENDLVESMNTVPPSNNISQQPNEASNVPSNSQNYTDSSLDTSPEHGVIQHQQGSIPLGSHAEHYAYYQQFENLSANRVDLSSGTQSNTPSGPVYNRTPDVIAAQQPIQHPGVPPSSDRNLYMQTGHLNEQDDVLNHEGQAYHGDNSRSSESSNTQQIFNQPSIHRPTTVPDGGNELPATTAGTARPVISDTHETNSVTDTDIPLDRLVLGESESVTNQQLPALPQTTYPLQSGVSNPSGTNWNLWTNQETNRIVTGEDDRRVPGAPSTTDIASLPTIQSNSVAQLQQPASLPPVTREENQIPVDDTFINSANDITSFQIEAAIKEADQLDVQDLEVRREAVGSERRDESVMGPPTAPFNNTQISTNNQRNVPMGQDAPKSLPSTSIIQCDMAKMKENDGKNDTDNMSSQHGANSYKENSSRNKNHKNKKDDKNPDYRSGKSKSKKHQNSRRSSTPDDIKRDSTHHRNRSPESSFSSSSNDRSSDLSESEDRIRDRRRYKGRNNDKERRSDKNFNRSSRHYNDSRRSDLDTSREKIRTGDRNKRRSEHAGYRDYNRRAETSRHDRDYRKGYSTNHPRGYRAGSYRDREYEYFAGYSGDRSYYDSRPSSRGATSDYYPIYEDPNYTYMHGNNSNFAQYVYPKVPPVEHTRNTLDPAHLEVFRKNWEYYKMWNPLEQQNLRQKNPAKYENLMSYYQLYGHQLPASSMRPPLSSNNSVKSDSGVKSPSTTNPLATSQTINSLASIGNNSTIFPPLDSYTDPTNYQPTPNVSTMSDDNKFGSYNNEIVGICDQISKLNHEIPIAEDKTNLQTSEIKEYNQQGNFMYDPRQRLTPVKFSTPHVKAVFSARGVLAKVDAKSPLDGQSATVEVHSLKSVLNFMPEFKDLSSFPGPLVAGTTHKGEVIQFCQNKIQDAKRKEGTRDDIVDRSSYILLWELLILLLRQKSAIDGCDIAELLLKDRQDFHKPYATDSPSSVTAKNSSDNYIESSEDEEVSDQRSEFGQGKKDKFEMGTIKHERSIIVKTKNDALSDTEAHVMKFRDYLLFGHKKEGLEYAMEHGLWGHALFLASKMDERSYSNVMLRFANGLVVNDPLQTLYQMMSGRQPIAVKECADSTWGDWRPHLAMILSNSKSAKDDLDIRSIKTLGDTLHDKGFLYAGQFCYLMAGLDFSSYENKNSKLVLIGGDRSHSFEAFPTNEAIQATEIYEYAQKLSNPEQMIPSLQYYKYIYAIRLIDYGLCNEALHYLEEISAHILKRPGDVRADNGTHYAVFIRNVLMLSEQLKYIDPSYLVRDGEVTDMPDPEWLIAFRTFVENSDVTQSHGYVYTHENIAASYAEPSPYEQMQSETVNTGNNVDNIQREESAMVAQYEHIDNVDMNFNYQQQPSSLINDGISMYNPQTAYSSSFDQPLQQPLSVTEKNGEQTSPYFINTASNNLNSQSSPSPEASDVTGYPSAGESIQASPAHYPNQKQDFQQETILEHAKAQETSNNYFTKSNFQPEISSDTQKLSENSPSSSTKKSDLQKPNVKNSNEGKTKSTGLFGWVKGKLGVKDDQVHMGDNLSLYYDEKLKRWVDPNADPNEDDGHNAKPPPTDMQLMGGVQMKKPDSTINSSSSEIPAGPPLPLGGNKYSAGGITKRRGVVDVFKNSQPSSNGPSTSNVPPLMPPPMVAPAATNLAPTNFMVPGNGNDGDLTPGDEIPSALNNNQDADNISSPQSGAPLMFFNPSQFSNQAISTPNM